MKLCHKCNVYYDDEELRFCSKCGSTLEEANVCPNCHTVNNSDFVFCIKCGAKLNGNSVGVSASNNTTQTTVPVQALPPTNVVKESIPTQNTPSPQIYENTTSEETSHTNWMMIIGGIIVIAGIILSFSGNSIFSSFKSNDTVSTNNQTSEPRYDALARANPNLARLNPLVTNKIFKSVEDAYIEALNHSKNSAKIAARALTNKDQRLYVEECYSNYETQDAILIVTCFLLPDTLTYPQKDIMDYWVIEVMDDYNKDKFQKHFVCLLYHEQLNKQTNEVRIIEKRAFVNQKLLTSKDTPKLELLEGDNTFKKRAELLNSELKHKFIELF